MTNVQLMTSPSAGRVSCPNAYRDWPRRVCLGRRALVGGRGPDLDRWVGRAGRVTSGRLGCGGIGDLATTGLDGSRGPRLFSPRERYQRSRRRPLKTQHARSAEHERSVDGALGLVWLAALRVQRLLSAWCSWRASDLDWE